MVMSGFVELPKLSRKVWQFSIVVAWTVFVVVYVWAFHIEPPHDDEYGKWLFASLFGAALPWAGCSVPLVLIVLSLETRYRPKRMWITVIWVLVVVCLALADIHRLSQPDPLPDPVWYKPVWRLTFAVEYFASQRLFPALFILAVSLWIEKKLVARGVLT
jgi:hypothetical protein